jgi:rSAM/selenodomain-associated transferase 1
MKIAGCRLIVFAKAPVPGQVKTRLIPAIGAKAAVALHEKLVLRSLAIAVNAGVGPVELWCAPSPEHPFFIHCAKKFQVEVRTQLEGDLGQRMAHAFYKTLEISTHVMLMGTDSPSLTCTDLKEAKAALQQDYDAVIIPAEDGGYVLLGLRQYSSNLFSGVSWGTEFVLEETRIRLRNLEWHWHELRKCWDVDRPEDLERLMFEEYKDLAEIIQRKDLL